MVLINGTYSQNTLDREFMLMKGCCQRGLNFLFYKHKESEHVVSVVKSRTRRKRFDLVSSLSRNDNTTAFTFHRQYMEWIKDIEPLMKQVLSG